MLKSVFIAIITIAVVALAGFGIYAYHSPLPAMTAEERPTFDAATIEKGRVLASAGYCSTCHTAEGGQPYAGNYKIETAFGAIYASNITPDPDTGIGTWSPEAFRRAMHEGVDREGAHLFPAFPFDHFAKMTDEDVDAIYAYVMSSVPPVKEETKENTIPFPLNLRILQAGWKLLFVDFGRYEPDPAKSAEWNRGAYLVEGISHCGACHTPRNAVGAEMTNAKFAGAEIDRWIAPALTAANPSALPWTASEFTQYLETGSGTYHGVAAGPMGPVVHAGLRELPKSDLEAIGAYLGDVVGAPAADPAKNPIVQASLEAGRPDQTYRKDLGERLYATACASCHYNATSVVAGRPDLAINSATRLDQPTNLIHVILDGVNAASGTKGVVMPAFRTALSDEEVAAIAGYLRDKRTDLAPWSDLVGKVAEIRAEAATK
ncbi:MULTISPECIES: c-type cytochrome [Alphaproteobacteria]|uniref:Cytochrome c n=2 Tax=Alphaproteobacteria TaxID=28211 RepID=A0A512HMG7_9HYPH|nr:MULTISPECIES: cytochrome c [Alphaproteobacteria]GEO86633.1 cytochrome c [Ciceribacter naphthalenivorans]GLR23637.1 cytochrome c [Ciceribacter naphthalenivorans]GLT06493.1 cytochrome c [Sphingomonas psychrolutea]